MSELIRMQQRIKAIDTIKKITHAMRLIAMSSHTRYKAQLEQCNTYLHAIKTVFYTLRAIAPGGSHPLLQSSFQGPALIIVIGSQKGLCGTFNSSLFKFLEHKVISHHSSPFFIAVGSKSVHYLNHLYPHSLIETYPTLSMTTLDSIASGIASFLISHSAHYSQVIIVHNEIKRFFLQKPTVSTLLPFASTVENIPSLSELEDYIWEMSSSALLDLLVEHYLFGQIYRTLFESLIAEQAARFISMDSATRNAQTMLQETKLSYHKLRQTKITKELIEITSQ